MDIAPILTLMGTGLLALASVASALVAARAMRSTTQLKGEVDIKATELKQDLDKELIQLKTDLLSEHEAMTRFRDATGPLRLELFLSTRSLIRRLQMYSRSPYELDATCHRNAGPYHDCGMLIYRLLRPIAVSSLIEPTMYMRDLKIDEVAMDFLDFNHAAADMLTGEKLGHWPPDCTLTLSEHPAFDMSNCWQSRSPAHPAASGPPSFPYQRFRSSYLKTAADALLVEFKVSTSSSSLYRKQCMSHAGFLELWENPDKDDEHREWHHRLESAKHFVHNFDRRINPIGWLRLVGYAYACKWFFDREAHRVEEEDEWRDHFGVDLDLERMIVASGDPYLIEYVGEYRRYFDQLVHEAL